MADEFVKMADPDAEEAILSAIFKDQIRIESIKLRPDEFSETHTRTLFQTMLDLWDQNCPVATGLLFHELMRLKRVKDAAPPGVGLKTYLDKLHNAPIQPDHIDHYIAIVRKYARIRGIIELNAKVINTAYQNQDPDELDAIITEGLMKLAGGRNDAVITWKESFERYEQILDARAKKHSLPVEQQSRWPYPWASWNELVDEPGPGTMILISAGTSVGKTIFGENMAECWGRNGHNIAYFHAELNEELMWDRRTARYTGMKRRDLVGKLTEISRDGIRNTNKALATWQGGVHYVPCPGWTSDQIVTQIRSMHAAGLCDAFVIDYLEKIQGTDQDWRRYHNEYAINANNMERLKNTAEALGIPGVVLAQLTKDGQEIPFEQLFINKIAGAKAVADKCNIVALIHRERLPNGQIDDTGKKVIDKGQRSRKTKVRIDKNTVGDVGVIEMEMTPSSFVVVDDKTEKEEPIGFEH